jgi:aerobic-type carbon monoxide dehydrogenase small subunit (CoxS/CutS family)
VYPRPDRERIREYVSANLCRRTGRSAIIDAVAAAVGSEESRAA